jgi:hypothetical protein
VLIQQFKNAPLDLLTQTELRLLLLSVIQKINVSFGQQNNINIEYKLLPFVTLDSEIRQITEQQQI